MIELQGINDTGIVEVIAEDVIINTAQDGLDLLGDAYYQGYDKIVCLGNKPVWDYKYGLTGG